MTIETSMWDLIVGKKLGVGTARTVYECRTNPNVVIKVEKEGQSFHNIIEWELWKEAQNFGFAVRWFAPCLHISAIGDVLIMQRTKPLEESKMPKRMPSWLCDFKPQNYGMFEGRVVCHDYGLAFPLGEALRSKRLKNVKWRTGLTT